MSAPLAKLRRDVKFGLGLRLRKFRHWLIAQAGPATMIGLVVIAVVLAAVGYAATALGWRLWIARKWQNRHS